MKISKTTNPITFQKLILVLLLIIGLPALKFTPYNGYAQVAQPQLTPIFALRAIIIVTGLLGAALSLALFLWDMLKQFRAGNRILNAETTANLFSHLSITLCSLSIGWAAFPYWVNGVFQGYSGHLPDEMTLNQLDPKALMPEIWIGDIWMLGVLLLFLLVICFVPFQLMFNMVFSIQNRDWKRAKMTILFSAIPIVIFLLSPGYLEWLID